MLTASAALTSACVKSRLQAKSGRAFSSEMKCERRQSRRLKTSHRLSNVAAPSEKGGGNKVCRAHVNPSFARIRIKREKRKRTRSRSKSGNDSKIQGEAEQGGEHIFCLEPRSGQRFVPLVFFYFLQSIVQIEGRIGESFSADYFSVEASDSTFG